MASASWRTHRSASLPAPIVAVICKTAKSPGCLKPVIYDQVLCLLTFGITRTGFERYSSTVGASSSWYQSSWSDHCPQPPYPPGLHCVTVHTLPQFGQTPCVANVFQWWLHVQRHSSLSSGRQSHLGQAMYIECVIRAVRLLPTVFEPGNQAFRHIHFAHPFLRYRNRIRNAAMLPYGFFHI